MTIPFEQIVSFGQQTMLDRPLFNVSWILGRFCNYNCSYCWPYARSDKLDYLPLGVYTEAINEIKRQANKNGFNQFHWSFSGGEPTAYKHLIDLVKHIESDMAASYQSLHMTTNLSPGSKWWNNWCNATSSLQRRSITASFHHEFAKEQEFGDKCLQLMYENAYITVNQVMVPDKWDELYERCERFRKRGINVTLKPQSNPTASAIVDGYTAEQLKLLQEDHEQPVHQIRLTDGKETYYIDQAERFNAFGFNQFQDWTCNSGYQSVIIRGDEVKRGYSCKDVPLGTLTNGFNLFNSPQLCITPTCVSSADSKIPKCLK